MEAHEKVIWTQDINSTEFTWICWPGSPCSGILPRIWGETPEYYMVVRVLSSERSWGQHSYCQFDAEFVVRVHNLPVSLLMVAIVNSSKFVFVCVWVCVCVYVVWCGGRIYLVWGAGGCVGLGVGCGYIRFCVWVCRYLWMWVSLCGYVGVCMWMRV